MAVTATTKRALEIYGGIEGDIGVFARDNPSRDFRKYLGYKQRYLYGDGKAYNAFPFAELVGGKIVGVFSAGVAHAVSDRQIMFVYDPTTDTVTTTVFVTDAAPSTFDTSLITPLMANGDVVTLKVWNFTKAAGVVSVAQLSTQAASGTTYAFFSAVKKRVSSGIYYRAGYGSGKAGLFSSPDGKAPWTFVGDIFVDAGKDFSEMDFVWRADDTLFAVCRESTGGSSTGNIYWTTAAGNGTSPVTATLFTNASINGVQPQLRLLSSGAILMTAADRSGSSGSSGDVPVFGSDTTGAAAWLLPAGSTPAVANWSFRQMLEQFYSSDGCQLWPVLLGTGEIVAPYYARRSVGTDPIIALMRFVPDKLTNAAD